MSHEPRYRYDIYAPIHKALRAWTSEALVKLGRNDWQDERTTQRLLAELRDLIPFCTVHLAHEDAFIHPVLARLQPGSAAIAEDEHARHNRSLTDLAAQVARLAEVPTADREALGHKLYLAFGEFIVIDFAHMLDEETRHNAILWQHLTDAEIMDIEHQIVASLTPQEMMQAMRWILPNLTAQERIRNLTGLRQAAPPPVFDAVLQMLKANLTEFEMNRLLEKVAA